MSTAKNSKETVQSVALVGLGGAGMSILKRAIEIADVKTSFDAFAVNVENWLEDVKFYRFDQVNELILELRKYSHVILAAGLGSSGGDSLAYLANRLDNTSIFVTKPFRVEKTRLKRAEEQLKMIGGAIVIVKDLDELLIKKADSPIGVVLDEVDREIAMEIMSKIEPIGKTTGE